MTGRAALCAGWLTLAVSALTPVCAMAAAPATREAPVQRSWLRESGTAAATKAKAAAGQSSRPVGTIVAGLLLVALVSGAFYQRWQRRRLASAARLSRIQVVSATRVGPKAQLVIASVGKRLLLLGVTDSQVTKLEWLDESLEAPPDAEADEEPPAREDAPSGAARGHFVNVLFDAMGRKRAAAADSTNAALELARQTRDFVSRSTEDKEKTRTAGRGAPRAPTSLAERNARPEPIMLAHGADSESIHVEGQAAGLVARLARSRQ